MFDSLKNLSQLPAMMAKAQKLQEQMKQMQEQLAGRRFTGDAAGGRVTASVNGRLELVDLRISRDQMDLSNTEMVQDLIVAAVRSAQYQAAEFVRQEMQRISDEVGIPPGMLPQQ